MGSSDFFKSRIDTECHSSSEARSISNRNQSTTIRLMKLPQELLSLVFEHLGTSELRRDVNYLVISKQWYSLAHPFFLSGLDATKIKLSAVSLAKYPPVNKESPLLSLIRNHAQHLSLRLLGHWWDNKTSRGFDGYRDPWEDTQGPLSGEDDEDNVPEADFTAADDNAEMDEWRKKVNASIQDLALSLFGFRSLETLRLEFSAEDDEKIGPI